MLSVLLYSWDKIIVTILPEHELPTLCRVHLDMGHRGHTYREITDITRKWSCRKLSELGVNTVFLVLESVVEHLAFGYRVHADMGH